MSTHFYRDIPSITDFYSLTQKEHYHRVPPSWYLVFTDIKGSTAAIEAGRYKDVNFVGAMGIVSLLNLAKEIEIPFIFGGDGATLFIPPELYESATLTLNSVRNIVKENYMFTLRVAFVKVSEIYNANKEILITKQQVSAHYTQAIVRGGGLEYIEERIKSEYERFALAHLGDERDHADFSSLECRWEEIDSPKEEVLTLLIKAKCDESYSALFAKMEAIFGTYSQRHPIKSKKLHLSFSPKKLRTEAALSAKTPLRLAFAIVGMACINAIGALLMAFRVGEWGDYKEHIAQTSDTQKFDEMFRTIISATKEQTQALDTYLKEQLGAGNLTYGLHKSTTSLMTCLVFERHGKHVHFVDGSNGGYALAAKMMKGQTASQNAT